MSATAIWNPAVSEERSPIASLLDLTLLQTDTQAAYAYAFDRVGARATLAAFAGPAPATDRLTLPPELLSFHASRRSPLVLRSDAGSDWRFTGFPELQSGGFDGLVSVPLIESGETVGLANFCRAGQAPLGAASLSFLMGLSLPLGALLIASTLRDRLHKITQDLADRKLIERAKGLIQARFECSEEEAYFRIRNWSRRSRTAMRDIASLLIESGADALSIVGEEQ
jgi:hypothetical protein